MVEKPRIEIQQIRMLLFSPRFVAVASGLSSKDTFFINTNNSLVQFVCVFSFSLSRPALSVVRSSFHDGYPSFDFTSHRIKMKSVAAEREKRSFLFILINSFYFVVVNMC